MTRAIKHPRRMTWMCAHHLAKADKEMRGKAKSIGLYVDKEREEQDRKRINGTALERVIYDRDLSFSEKINVLNL